MEAAIFIRKVFAGKPGASFFGRAAILSQPEQNNQSNKTAREVVLMDLVGSRCCDPES
jgi:hypothetical protein